MTGLRIENPDFLYSIFFLKTEEPALMAHPSTTLYSMLRCSTNRFCLKNCNYRTKEKPTEQRIERKQEMWGLTSPKMSLLQCKVNGGWNMTPEGAARGGTRAPNAHDG